MCERKFRHFGIFINAAWRIALARVMRFVAAMKALPSILFAVCLASACHVFAAEPKQPAVANAPVRKDVTPDEAALLMKANPGAPLVLDVRTPDEFAEGHIPGAMNADFLGEDFEKQIAALPADRPLIVHCAAGSRSAKAVAKIAAIQKSAQIFHLKSGFNGWKAAGKPIETKPSAK